LFASIAAVGRGDMGKKRERTNRKSRQKGGGGLEKKKKRAMHQMLVRGSRKRLGKSVGGKEKREKKSKTGRGHLFLTSLTGREWGGPGDRSPEKKV